VSRVTDHDVLYGYRLQLFALAARTTVSHACRTFGVHRSTYYRWKRQVDRHGLGMLRPRERRSPRLPNQLSMVVEQRIVAFALGHPGSGPDRIAAELARAKWGGIIVSPNGVWRVLRRHGLNTRTQRLALIAGYQAPYQPPRQPPPEPHRGHAARRAGRYGLLLRRPPAGYQAPGLAGHRDRLLLLLRLGRPGHLPHRPTHPPADQQPGSPRRRRSGQGPGGSRTA
jgi:transposase